MPLPGRPFFLEYRKHRGKCLGNEEDQPTEWSKRNLCLLHMSELKQKKYHRPLIIGGEAVSRNKSLRGTQARVVCCHE